MTFSILEQGIALLLFWHLIFLNIFQGSIFSILFHLLGLFGYYVLIDRAHILKCYFSIIGT